MTAQQKIQTYLYQSSKFPYAAFLDGEFEHLVCDYGIIYSRFLNYFALFMSAIKSDLWESRASFLHKLFIPFYFIYLS